MKNTKSTFFGVAFLAMLLCTLTNCNDAKPAIEERAKVTAPAQIVTVEQAKMMYDTYGKRRVPLIRRYENKIDSARHQKDAGYRQAQDAKTAQESRQAVAKPFDVTRYVSYEYDTIKKYIAYIEQEAERAGVKISTLRFYLSNYPEKDLFPKDTAARVRHNSVFITPTLRKGNREYPYYGEEGEDGRLQMVLLNDTLTKSKTQLVGTWNKKPETSVASVFPSLTSTEGPPAPLFFASKSYTLNKGTGAPPPYPQN